MCAHKTDIVIAKKAQTEVNHHLRAEDNRIQSNAWQHSRLHPHLTLFIARQVTLFSAECPVPITARKKKKKKKKKITQQYGDWNSLFKVDIQFSMRPVRGNRDFLHNVYRIDDVSSRTRCLMFSSDFFF